MASGRIVEIVTAPSPRIANSTGTVAFSQGPFSHGYDSDIFVFERKTGILTNLTDDDYEGTSIFPPRHLATLPVDLYPAWSADSTRKPYTPLVRPIRSIQKCTKG